VMGYLIFFYLGLGIILIIVSKCFSEWCLRYVYKQYPDEEACVNRLHEDQWYPWAKSQKVLRTLVKNKIASDPELARRVKMSKYSCICLFVWFGLFVLVFAISAIHHLITTQ